MSSPRTDIENPREETGYYEPYSHYHKSVRLWFLAYGIGAPVFLTQFPGAVESLKAEGLLRGVTLLFLTGVVIQIGAALTYKTAMWYLYLAELRRIPKTAKRVRVSGWLSLAYWLEFIFDGVTLAAFGVATWLTVLNVT